MPRNLRVIRWSVRGVCFLLAVALLFPLLAPHQAAIVVPSLSPFVAVAAWWALGSLPAFAWLGLIVGLVALIRARWFCRWVCPTGFCADEASRLGRRCGRTALRAPRIGEAVVLLTWGGALAGYPLLLWLDPLSLFSAAFRLAGPAGYPGWWWSATGLLSVLLLSLIWPQLWCARCCPLGAVQDLLWQVGRRVQRLGWGGRSAGSAAGSRQGRRAVLGLAAGAAGAFWLRTRGGGLAAEQPAPTRPLRPPGAVPEPAFAGLCLRCGNCVRICPSRIVQNDPGQHGPAGFLAPRLHFDHDYCREDCVACTQVCPSGALTRLSSDAKPQVQIGLPRVDMNRCLLGDARECSICRAACPYEAIHYEFCEIEYTLTPRIDPTRCNGCGACQVACPTEPQKAIVVQGHTRGQASLICSSGTGRTV